MFNGICLLPVLLSWFGPAPYLNANRISWSKSDSSTTDSYETPVCTKSPQTPASEKPLTQPDSTEMQLVRQNATAAGGIKPKTQDVAIQAFKTYDSDDGIHHDEIGALLDDLEQNSAHHQYLPTYTAIQSTGEASTPKTLDDIIAKCEEYLAKASET